MIWVGVVVGRKPGSRAGHDHLVAVAFAVAVAAGLLGGCHATDRLFCNSGGCEWTKEEWARLQTLSPLPPPPPDPSNKYWNNPQAAALGQRFYFDPKFSGNSTLVDQLGNPVPYARTPKDSAVNVGCMTCHDPRRAGGDFTSAPNTIAMGAGWYDVNGQQTVNAAYYPLLYWNGRADSLWVQAAQVTESGVSMNGSRLAVFARLVNDASYRTAYNELFGAEDPSWILPDAVSEPRFPAIGKPDSDGKWVGGADGKTELAIGEDDGILVTRAFVNWAKAIAAYEYQLVGCPVTPAGDSCRPSPFDEFIKEGPDSDAISPAAKRGARLFVGKASCIDCHDGPLFSDGEFHDIGVPQTGPHVPTVADCNPKVDKCDCTPNHEAGSCFPAGAWAGLTKLKAASKQVLNDFRRDSPWSDVEADPVTREKAIVDADPTRQEIFTKTYQSGPVTSDKGAWRTPSLRDVALTAPYMHDGVYATLDDVVWHYNNGGSDQASNPFRLPVCGQGDAGSVDGGVACMDPGVSAPGRAAQIKPLALTADEATDLVEFLKTLTGAPLAPELVKAPPQDGGAVPDAGGTSPDGAVDGPEAGTNP